jgi:hypothetical protein
VNYLFYRRIKGPVFLVTFGVTALLAQWHILSFGKSWPLYLIVYGVLRLGEGAALAASASAVFPGGFGYQPPAPSAATPAPGTGLATVAPAPLEPGFTPVNEREK